jgi:hypothetical protein
MTLDKNLLRRLAGIPTATQSSVGANSADSSNRARILAGLSELPVKENKDEKPKELEDDLDSTEASDDKNMEKGEPAEEPMGDAEDDELPQIIKDLAAQAAGKSDEELEELMIQIYKAGVKDGEEKSTIE